MGSSTFNGHLLIIGFAATLVGVVLAVSSVSMLSDYGALSDAAVKLLVGAAVAVAGILLIVASLFSPRRTFRSYY